MDSMTTSETLHRAADLIEERGWNGLGYDGRSNGGGQGWDRGDGAPLCLEGGIMAALGMRDENAVDHCPAYGAVVDHLGTDDHLWGWNDSPDRTASEVIEVLRATALIEAAKENAETRIEATA